MDSISLTARPRSETGRHVHHPRREGVVPAVLYGHKVAAVALSVDAKEMERTWHHAGRTHLVDVHLECQKGARKALIKDLQIHPRSGRRTWCPTRPRTSRRDSGDLSFCAC